MDTQGRKNRKLWLILLCLYPVLCFLLGFPISYLGNLGEHVVRHWGDRMAECICAGLISAPFLYFCAYRKPGTILLAWSIVFSWVRVVALPFAVLVFFAVHRRSDLHAASIEFCVGGVLVGFEVVWLVTCRRLRRANIRQQQNEIAEVEEFQPIFAALRSETSLEDLSALFRRSLQKYPAIETFLRREYRMRKRELHS